MGRLTGFFILLFVFVFLLSDVQCVSTTFAASTTKSLLYSSNGEDNLSLNSISRSARRLRQSRCRCCRSIRSLRRCIRFRRRCRCRSSRRIQSCSRLTIRYRTYSGKCNNRRYPGAGSAGTSVLPKSKLRRVSRRVKSARAITNAMCREPFVRKNRRGLSELTTFFGQFLDHDLAGSMKGKEKWNIPIPAGDPAFQGRSSIPFTRNKRIRAFRRRSRAPVNMLSHYIDASTLYGSSKTEAARVRHRSSRYVRMQAGKLFAFRNGSYLSGDARVNENPFLVAFHTLFSKEHNRVADEVKAAYRKLDEERIFQLARLIVGAEMQAIVYYEFIPAVLGRMLPRYRGYNPRRLGSVTNEFSTVAFRVGHTMLTSHVTFIDKTGHRTQTPLGDTFFRPDLFKRFGLDAFIRGMLSERAGEIDNGITKEVLDFLIDSGKDLTRLDLAALNVQRGRDHGIPLYNDLREAMGLKRVVDFSEITSSSAVADRLKRTYGSCDRIDAWIGGLCEDHTTGSLGPLFEQIWIDQFLRLRDGDRFYFENRDVFSDDEVERIPTLRRLVGSESELGNIMKRVIEDNTNVESYYLHDSPFFV